MPAGKFIFIKRAIADSDSLMAAVQIVLDASDLQRRVHQRGSKMRVPVDREH
jgi:hypothetical protein